jgi:DNA-binding PadR family transcriptional regulator
VRGFIQARILLELNQKPAYGYELMEALGEDADLAPDPGGLYRALRCMEEEGLVQSTWDVSSSGPARRIYQLTGLGSDTLEAWAVTLRRTRQWLDDFLENYETHTQQRSYANG